MGLNILQALHALLGQHVSQAQVPPQASSSQLRPSSILGIKNIPIGPDQARPFQYRHPIAMPTFHSYNPGSTMQRYGDKLGNQWLEDPSGNRFPVPKAPQAFDAPLNQSFHDPLRPGQSGRFPVNDGVAPINPNTQPVRITV